MNRLQPWGLICLLTLVGGVLRFAALGAKSLWLDESFSVWVAGHTLPDLVTWLIRIDHHPPLYYALLRGWVALFGDSETALRSLSALCSTLAIPFFYLAAYRFTGTRAALIATTLLVLSPFQIRYAQEARMYALLTFTVAALLAVLGTLLITWRSESTRPRTWIWAGLAVSQAAAMLTHNTATVLVPLALNIGVLAPWLHQRLRAGQCSWPALAQRHFLRNWIFAQTAALALWLPWAWPFVQQARVVDNEFWIEAPTLIFVWESFSNLIFAHLPEWLPVRPAWTALGLLLAGIGFWRGRAPGATRWLLGALWLVPPLVELLVSLRRPIFYDRTLIWITLPYFMLVGLSLNTIASPLQSSHWRHRLAEGVLALYLLLCSLGITYYFTTFTKQHWDQVAAHVAQYATPTDLLLYSGSWMQLSFDYYFRTYDLDLAQHGIPVDLFDWGILEPPMTPADVPRLQQLVQERDQVWLIYANWWYTDPTGLVLETLDAEMQRVDEQTWPGIRLLRYQAR